MKELGFWGSLWFLLWNPYTWTQCKAERPVYRGAEICQRHRWHRGPHRTYTGVAFTCAGDNGGSGG